MNLREFSDKYLSLLKGEFSGINLTRIESDEEFFQKQIVDSVLPLEKSKIFKDHLYKDKVAVDIGFGGGFPVLPLAFTNPEIKFLGFDARAKKANVVSQIADQLNLKNVKLGHQRFEEVFFDKNVVVTFKAVGKVAELLPMFKGSAEIKVFFYKGPNFYELEDIEDILKDWELIEETSFDVPGTEGRLFLGFKNKKVLRGTNVNKNIKFSELL